MSRSCTCLTFGCDGNIVDSLVFDHELCFIYFISNLQLTDFLLVPFPFPPLPSHFSQLLFVFPLISLFTHTALLPSHHPESLSSRCLSLYPDLPSSALLFLSPSVSTSSFRYADFLNLELHLKSQPSSSSLSVSLALPHLHPSLCHFLFTISHIFLDIHIYMLNFSYIFSPSPFLSLSSFSLLPLSLSLSTSSVPVFHA